MANQHFEVGGLRIDLSKIRSYSHSNESSGKGKFDLRVIPQGFEFPGVQLPDSQIEPFLAAVHAYRESLKPKYQFKDGWYICKMSGDPHATDSEFLRYVKSDVTYSACGRRRGVVSHYSELNPIDEDDQPPCPDSLRD